MFGIWLDVSYRVENVSISIKTITSNGWNHPQTFKIVSNIGFNPKLTQHIHQIINIIISATVLHGDWRVGGSFPGVPLSCWKLYI